MLVASTPGIWEMVSCLLQAQCSAVIGTTCVTIQGDVQGTVLSYAASPSDVHFENQKATCDSPPPQEDLWG